MCRPVQLLLLHHDRHDAEPDDDHRAITNAHGILPFVSLRSPDRAGLLLAGADGVDGLAALVLAAVRPGRGLDGRRLRFLDPDSQHTKTLHLRMLPLPLSLPRLCHPGRETTKGCGQRNRTITNPTNGRLSFPADSRASVHRCAPAPHPTENRALHQNPHALCMNATVSPDTPVPNPNRA